MPAPTGPRWRRRCGHAAALALCAGLVLLAGCGKGKDKPASQTAAKVNKEEITVHQINFMLQQQGRAIPPELAASASRQVLDRLIDQELALQKAQELKLDRDARVVQQLEAARRDVIARAYLESVAVGATAPTADEVHTYYDAHPELFKDRRVFSFQELLVEATPDQVAQIKSKVEQAKTLEELVDYLNAAKLKFAAKQAIRAAEQLPLTAVARIAQMKDGQGALTAVNGGAQIVWMVQSRPRPVELAQAKVAIEKYLLNERKRKLVDDNMKALRQSAQIQYVGEYADTAPANGAAAVASAPLPSITEAPASASLLGEVEPASAGNTAPASAPSASTIDKGMKGLK